MTMVSPACARSKAAARVPSRAAPSACTAGTTVKVESDDGSEKYAIVGPAEADPLHGMISNESPLGRALLGHKAGDEVEWSAPSGTSRVKILAVN